MTTKRNRYGWDAHLDNVTTSLRLFHSNRPRLLKAYKSLKGALITANVVISTVLDDAELADHVSGSLPLDTEQADEAIRGLYQANNTALNFKGTAQCPFVVVVGQANSGKTSLINELLQQDVFDDSDGFGSPLLTRITYGENLRTRRCYPDSRSDDWQSEHGPIPSERVHLSSTEECPKQDGEDITVEVEAPNQLLRAGIDMYESPNIDENLKLTELMSSAFESFIPMIIYVIDGRNQLTKGDVSDLYRLKRSHPTSHIFYVVTKLDTPRSKHPLGTHQTIPEEDKAMETMQEIHATLKCRGFLPDEDEFDFEHSCRLFGVSLTRPTEWNQTVFEQNMKSPPLFIRSFERLREEIFRFIQKCLDDKMEKAATELQKLATTVLKGCLRYGGTHSHTCVPSEQYLQIKEELTESIYKHLSQVLAVDKEVQVIGSKVDRFLSECRKRVADKAEKYEYTQAGPLLDEARGRVTTNVVQRCRDELLEFVFLCLTTELWTFLEQRIIHEQLELLQQGMASWNPKIDTMFSDELQSKNDGEENEEMQKVLQLLTTETTRGLLSAYRKAFSETERRIWITAVFNSIRTLLKSFWNRLTSLLRSRSTHAAQAQDPQGSEWKANQTNVIFEQVQSFSIGVTVCEMLKNFVGQVHRDQKVRLEFEKVFSSNFQRRAADFRSKIEALVPPFAKAYLEAYNVISRCSIRNVRLSGYNSQGSHHQCQAIQQGEKTTLDKMNIVFPRDRLSEQAMEIFISAAFNHPHLLPVVGIHYDVLEDKNHCSISLFTPIQTRNCLNFLLEKEQLLCDRLNVAMHVSEALLFLHNEGIIHRTIRLDTILIDNENHSFVVDYSRIEPVDSKCDPSWDSLFFMAPEILPDEGQKMTHTEAVDTYAFGVLLWFLVEGSGKFPSYSCDVSEQHELIQAIRSGQRPNRPDTACADLWSLICECWSENSQQRPTMQAVNRRLKACLS